MNNPFGNDVTPEFHIDWDRLWHVFMVGNGKGGVGKTSIAANTAGKAARGGLRTLLVDFNAQGNIARELGYKKAETNDDGRAFLDALQQGTPLVPLKDVRDNLDVVIGGRALTEMQLVYVQLVSQYGVEAYRRLLYCLLPIVDDYDIVVIDTPPENPPLQKLALAASRWLIIPVKSDGGAEDGLAQIGTEFSHIAFQSKVNPHLTLLGVVLFDTGRNHTAIHADVRGQVERILGGAAHMFRTVIGHTEAVAKLVRERGLLVSELYTQHEVGDRTIPGTIEALHKDYEKFTDELYARAAELRAEMEAAS